MKYQLVIQLLLSAESSIDKLLALEEAISSVLEAHGYVDGHDIGAGQMNIFIHCEDVNLTYQCISHLLMQMGTIVAYREIGKSNYTVLYPSNTREFSIT